MPSIQVFLLFVAAPFMVLAVVVEEHKQSQLALRQSEDKLRLLLDSTGEGIYGVDLEERCTFCNPACLRALGYECVDELLGKHMHGLIHYARADGTSYPVEECRNFRAVGAGEESMLTTSCYGGRMVQASPLNSGRIHSAGGKRLLGLLSRLSTSASANGRKRPSQA